MRSERPSCRSWSLDLRITPHVADENDLVHGPAHTNTSNIGSTCPEPSPSVSCAERWRPDRGKPIAKRDHHPIRMLATESYVRRTEPRMRAPYGARSDPVSHESPKRPVPPAARGRGVRFSRSDLGSRGAAVWRRAGSVSAVRSAHHDPYLHSYQFLPTPQSATSGTFSSTAPSMRATTSSRTASTSASGTSSSNSSCTCRSISAPMATSSNAT